MSEIERLLDLCGREIRDGLFIQEVFNKRIKDRPAAALGLEIRRRQQRDDGSSINKSEKDYLEIYFVLQRKSILADRIVVLQAACVSRHEKKTRVRTGRLSEPNATIQEIQAPFAVGSPLCRAASTAGLRRCLMLMRRTPLSACRRP